MRSRPGTLLAVYTSKLPFRLRAEAKSLIDRSCLLRPWKGWEYSLPLKESITLRIVLGEASKGSVKRKKLIGSLRTRRGLVRHCIQSSGDSVKGFRAVIVSCRRRGELTWRVLEAGLAWMLAVKPSTLFAYQQRFQSLASLGSLSE